MFNLMRKHHKKFIGLKNLTPRTENNKKLKQKVLIDAGIFTVHCITFTNINTIKNKQFKYRK